MSRIRVSAAALLLMVSGSTFAAGPVPLPVPTLPGLSLITLLPTGMGSAGMPSLPGLSALTLFIPPNGLAGLPGLGALPGQHGFHSPPVFGLLPGASLPGLGLLTVPLPPALPGFGSLPAVPGGG